MHLSHTEVSRDQKLKRKLIRVTSSNERREQICIVLKDYKSHLNEIWYTA